MIPFKILTANWPTDVNETWRQNGDNDDNVDDIDDKEEKEEENDDDDDDADVDSGVGASCDDVVTLLLVLSALHLVTLFVI